MTIEWIKEKWDGIGFDGQQDIRLFVLLMGLIVILCGGSIWIYSKMN